MIFGGKQCKGKKITGVRCRYTATEGDYCFYCNKLIRGETTPWHMGYDPRKGRLDSYDWCEAEKWRVK